MEQRKHSWRPVREVRALAYRDNALEWKFEVWLANWIKTKLNSRVGIHSFPRQESLKTTSWRSHQRFWV